MEEDAGADANSCADLAFARSNVDSNVHKGFSPMVLHFFVHVTDRLKIEE